MGHNDAMTLSPYYLCHSQNFDKNNIFLENILNTLNSKKW